MNNKDDDEKRQAQALGELVSEIDRNAIDPMIQRDESPLLVFGAVCAVLGTIIYRAGGDLDAAIEVKGLLKMVDMIKLGHRIAKEIHEELESQTSH